MKFCGFIVNIPLIFLIIFGHSFYELWVPNENTIIINILAILTVSCALVQGIVNPLFNVFTITNKLKLHSTVIVMNGLINTVLVIILLKTTDFGIYAIAGVSSLTAILRDLFYTPIYSACCLNVSKKSFYPVIIKYILSTTVLMIIFYLFKLISISDTWLMLIINAGICGVLGLITNYLIILGKDERLVLIEMFKIVIEKYSIRKMEKIIK